MILMAKLNESKEAIPDFLRNRFRNKQNKHLRKTMDRSKSALPFFHSILLYAAASPKTTPPFTYGHKKSLNNCLLRLL